MLPKMYREVLFAVFLHNIEIDKHFAQRQYLLTANFSNLAMQRMHIYDGRSARRRCGMGMRRLATLVY